MNEYDIQEMHKFDRMTVDSYKLPWRQPWHNTEKAAYKTGLPPTVSKLGFKEQCMLFVLWLRDLKHKIWRAK